jgi:hypothetical protein
MEPKIGEIDPAMKCRIPAKWTDLKIDPSPGDIFASLFEGDIILNEQSLDV